MNERELLEESTRRLRNSLLSQKNMLEAVNKDYPVMATDIKLRVDITSYLLSLCEREKRRLDEQRVHPAS